LPNEGVAEVERRFASYREELQASGELGETLVRRAAVLSVRLDRCVSHETASLAGRIRQADADFVAPAGADAATIAQLRAEARARAMFDPSPEANLARRHEAATERSFFKVLNELRQMAQDSRQDESPAADGFRDSLASIFQLEKEGDEFEARYLEPEERMPFDVAKYCGKAGLPPVGPTADVPFAIGRPR
jgi:hypothetical protein